LAAKSPAGPTVAALGGRSAWLPLGGYVRFVDDEHHSGATERKVSKNPRSFAGKPVWQRFLIVLAGPMANFLLAIIIFACFFAAWGVPRTPNVVIEVQPGSAAVAAGLQPGDRIEAVAGQRTSSFEDVQRVVSLRPGEEVSIRIVRDGGSALVHTTLGATRRRTALVRNIGWGCSGSMPAIASSKACRRSSLYPRQRATPGH
jgi:regulator of sigma E protease